MTKNLMMTSAATALCVSLGAQGALAGNGNQAFTLQDGLFNQAVIDQANANFARVGSASLPFVQEGNVNILSILQIGQRTNLGPIVANQTASGANAGTLNNGFQLGTGNILQIIQRDEFAPTSGTALTNVNIVPLVFQEGNGNIGRITQDAFSTWNIANLRQIGTANIADIDQDAPGTAPLGTRQNRNSISSATTGFGSARSGGAIQEGTANVMRLTQLANVGNGANTIIGATQSGTANLMNVSQTGNNFGLDFGTANSAHGFAGSLVLPRYTSSQTGEANFLNLIMTSGGTQNFLAAGVVFATAQNGSGNTGNVTITGDFTEFALSQIGALNNTVGDAFGNRNDMAVRQVGVSTTVNIPFFGPVTIPGGGNDAIFSVLGNNNEMLIDQAGNLNDAEVRIFGDDNKARSTQIGNLNDADVHIDGDLNTALSTQTGNGNDVLVKILGDSNDATLVQTGPGNSADVTITGDFNTADSTQQGASNDWLATIVGNDNTATLDQIGDLNFASLDILGNDNTSTLGSFGNSNSITGTVEGNSNTSTVMQNGNSNTAVFTQLGNSNTVSIMQ